MKKYVAAKTAKRVSPRRVIATAAAIGVLRVANSTGEREALAAVRAGEKRDEEARAHREDDEERRERPRRRARFVDEPVRVPRTTTKPRRSATHAKAIRAERAFRVAPRIRGPGSERHPGGDGEDDHREDLEQQGGRPAP